MIYIISFLIILNFLKFSIDYNIYIYINILKIFMFIFNRLAIPVELLTNK